MTNDASEQPANTPDATLAELLELATLAPSAHNAQPWTVRLQGATEISVARNDATALQAGDPTRRQTVLSLAMFIETFVIAARHHGFDVAVDVIGVVPNDPVLASLRMAPARSPEPSPLYGGIRRRHTNRGPYHASSVPPWLQERDLTREGEARLFVVSEPAAIERIGSLVGEGMTTALRLTSMRQELANLTYWQDSDASQGMALEALIPGAERDELTAADWFLAQADPEREGGRIGRTFGSSPFLLIVATEADDPTAWLDAGRLACRVLLRGATENLTHDISAAPVEIPTLAPLLGAEIESGWRPQILARIGEPQAPDLTLPSVRRPVVLE